MGILHIIADSHEPSLCSALWAPNIRYRRLHRTDALCKLVAAKKLTEVKLAAKPLVRPRAMLKRLAMMTGADISEEMRGMLAFLYVMGFFLWLHAQAPHHR